MRRAAEEFDDELALLETHMGKILAECKWDVDDVIYCFEYYAGKAVELDAKQGVAVPLPDVGGCEQSKVSKLSSPSSPCKHTKFYLSKKGRSASRSKSCWFVGKQAGCI